MYPHPLGDWSPAGVLAGLAALVGLSLLACWQARRRPWLLVGWLWFVGTLLPVIGLAQGGAQAWADRFSYWPHIGLFIALVWAAAELLERLRAPVLVGASAAALVLIGLAAATWQQVGYWHDTVSLWGRALAVTRGNYPAHACLGKYYHGNGQLDLAEEHWTGAVRLRPYNVEYRYSLGTTLLALGKLDEAAENLQVSLRHSEDFSDGWYNLAIVYLRQGRNEEAARCFRRVLDLQPGSPDALAGLGKALLGQGQQAEAIQAFQTALARNPREAEAWHGLGRAYLVQGQPDQAMAAFSRALQANPQMASASSDLGLALGRRGQWREAARWHRAAIQREEQGEEFLVGFNGRLPTQDGLSRLVIFQCRLGLALNQLADSEGASAVYQSALRRQPDWPRRFTARAWRLATHPDEKHRDPQLAWEMARQAIEGSGEPTVAMLDALAAAQAGLGQFPQAARTVQRALKQASGTGQTALVDGLAGRLRLYQQRKMFAAP
jgi:tetratricopeptide (TPR) repeat protein